MHISVICVMLSQGWSDGQATLLNPCLIDVVESAARRTLCPSILYP